MVTNVKLWTFCAFIILWSLSTPSYSNGLNGCQQVSRVCSEGAETRTIDGVKVTRDCWNYSEEYFCRTGEYQDTCSGLNSYCHVTDTTCKAKDPSGYCTLTQKTFECGEKQTTSTATLLDSTYTVVQDDINHSQCSSYDNNDTCTETGRTCIEGAKSKIINGKSIYKECWKWRSEYSCFSGSYNNICRPLEGICTQIKNECVKFLFNGECAIEKKTFDCDEYQSEKKGIVHVDTKYSIVKDAWDKSDCEDLGLECGLEKKVCVENGETRVINGLPVYKSCWRYRNDYVCLSGETVSTCNEIDGQACIVSNEKCIVRTDSGLCSSTVKEYDCTYKSTDETVLDCGEQIFCLGDDCYDSGYEANNEFGLAAAYLGTALASGKDVDSADDIDIFTGHKSMCTQYPLNTVDCCSDEGWANGSFTGCSNEDKTLITERQNKLTHYVGTYCSKKLPIVKTCIEHKQSYCSYQGMLARIIQEGGRKQINMSWGSPKNPSCSGFSPDDLTKVDFTLINFQEYIDQMDVGDIDNDELAKKVENRVKQLTQ